MTSPIVKAALGALIVAGSASGVASRACAMPVLNGEAVKKGAGSNVETVRWVCGPYRCWWRPNYYYGGGYGYYGAPAYLGGYWSRPGWGRPGWGRHDDWDHDDRW